MSPDYQKYVTIAYQKYVTTFSHFYYLICKILPKKRHRLGDAFVTLSVSFAG